MSGRSISFLTSPQRLQVARADTLLPREKRPWSQTRSESCPRSWLACRPQLTRKSRRSFSKRRTGPALQEMRDLREGISIANSTTNATNEDLRNEVGVHD